MNPDPRLLIVLPTLLMLLGAAVAEIVVNLLLFWSVYVKGHIVSRAISREWYVGMVIAIAVFLLQYAFTNAAVTAS